MGVRTQLKDNTAISRNGLFLLVVVALAAITMGCGQGQIGMDSAQVPSPTPEIPFALRKPMYLPSGISSTPDVQYDPGPNGKAGLTVLVIEARLQPVARSL